MRVSVKKWGNSAAIRIPGSILDAAKLAIDQAVNIHEKDGCIVIEPLRPADDDLVSLINAITEDNRHAEIDFGKPVGNEML